MVSLDSEGIDAVMGEGLDDNHIFTFIVLLASVLIDNSMGVATRYDLNGLEYLLTSTSDFRGREISGGGWLDHPKRLCNSLVTLPSLPPSPFH